MSPVLVGLLVPTVLAALVARVVFALGLSFGALVGVDIVIDRVTLELAQLSGSIGTNIEWLLVNTGVSTGLRWILAAYAASLTLRSGSLWLRAVGVR